MVEGQSARWRPRVLDPAGLRTTCARAIICNDDMAYVDTLRCEGDWGRVPFDHRIQQIISRRKHAARFKTQASEISVYQMLQFLADDAKTDWSIGQDFCYFMSYLKRMVTPEELAAAQIEYGSEEAPWSTTMATCRRLR